MRTWTMQQLAVFKNVAEGGGHTVVLARAGTGKTTTIEASLAHVRPGKRVVCFAFGRGNARELARRVPAGVEATTLHSFGLKTILRNGFKPAVESEECRGDKMKRIIERHLPEPERLEGETEAAFEERVDRVWDLRRSLLKACALAKAALVGAGVLPRLDVEVIDEIVDRHEIMPPDSEEERPAFAESVRRCLAMSLEDMTLIDFDDMVYVPVARRMRCRQFDHVFIDETQDLTPAQLELGLRACAPGGRITAVGDDRQSVYAFRGADSDAVPHVIRRLRAAILPLSVTFRCAKAIVRVAAEYVPDYEAAETAPEGAVTEGVTLRALVEGARPGDFVLSRTNAPLLGVCLRLLKRGTPAAIQGRELGQKLEGLIRRSRATTVPELCAWARAWCDAECQRLAALDRDPTAVTDTAECVYTLAEGAQSVGEVVSRIAELFAGDDDRAPRVLLSSTHKAKGLERDRVWVLRSTYLRPAPKGRPPHSPQRVREEENLLYVAVTRARACLFLVTEVPTAARAAA